MPAITSNASSPTEPLPEKPKLDIEDEDELSDSDYGVCEQREVSLDRLKKELPHEYEVIIDLCKLAVVHYQDSHPGESYEFESVQKAMYRTVAGSEYSLTFCAKNLKADGNPIEIFEAVGYDLIIVGCVLLK